MRPGSTPHQRLNQNDWTVSHSITCDDVSDHGISTQQYNTCTHS